MANDKQQRDRPRQAPKPDPNRKGSPGREQEGIHRSQSGKENPEVEPFDEESLAERLPSGQEDSDE